MIMNIIILTSRTEYDVCSLLLTQHCRSVPSPNQLSRTSINHDAKLLRNDFQNGPRLSRSISVI